MDKLAFLVTPYQATVLHAALEVFESETELAITAGAFIDNNAGYTDGLLTDIQLVEEAKVLRGQLILRFGFNKGGQHG